MIVSVQDALDYLNKEIPEKDLKRKIMAIESMIRDETGNNFQERKMRFYAPSVDGVIVGISQFLETGDTIEINESINDGIYSVEEIGGDIIRLDRKLYVADRNMITKVIYPEAVKDGVLNMLQWELKILDRYRSKIFHAA